MVKRRSSYTKKYGKYGDSSSSDSDSSSDSGSDSDSIPDNNNEVEEEVEEEQQPTAVVKKKSDNKKTKNKQPQQSSSSSSGSGYESEDSSANVIEEADSEGLPTEEEEQGIKRDHWKARNLKDGQLTNETGVDETEEGDSRGNKKNNLKDLVQSDLADCILKCKSVYKCKLCPRIVCLSEDTTLAHLKSKRHARSEKLLKEGRLKLMLNSDGEIEEDQETHAERHNRTVAVAQESVAPVKKNKGRQRQNQRRKKRLRNGSNKGKSEQASGKPSKNGSNEGKSEQASGKPSKKKRKNEN